MKALTFALLLSAVSTFAESFAELLKKANGGDAVAQFRVAMAYHYGKQTDSAGIREVRRLTNLEASDFPTKNQAEGLRFRLMAVKLNFPPAQAFHGSWLYLVQRNPSAAFPVSQQAANQGNGDAMRTLAEIYFARKDIVEGLKWEILARRFGGERADPELKVLANVIYPMGVREAWKRADAFVPKVVFVGDYSPTKRRGVELEDLLAIAEKVQRGAR